MNLSKSKVLIVEDEAILALSVKELVLKYGYEVAGMASNFTDAVRISKEEAPDLVLMDIRINGNKDGIDTAREIKDICGASVVFITAYSDSVLFERCLSINPSGYIVKPFREQELRNAIRIALNQRLFNMGRNNTFFKT